MYFPESMLSFSFALIDEFADYTLPRKLRDMSSFVSRGKVLSNAAYVSQVRSHTCTLGGGLHAGCRTPV